MEIPSPPKQMNNVIHIYGASGSGTSTLAEYIGRQLNFAWMDSDDYYWIPTDPMYTVKRTPAERVVRMKQDIGRFGDVVISGSLVDWGDELIPLFTLAVRVVTDTQTRLERIRRREYEKFGSRIEVGGDMYRHHQDFLQWAAGYDDGDLHTRSKRKHDQWQKKLKCPLIVVDGKDSLEKNYKLVQKAIFPT